MCADIDNETSTLNGSKGSEKRARRVRAGSSPRACVADEGRTSCLCNLCCHFFRVTAVQVRESISLGSFLGPLDGEAGRKGVAGAEWWMA